MEIHPVDILIYVINITVLFIMLRWILWKPVNRFLSSRTERISGELDKAAKTLSDADTLKEEYTRKIGDIEAQGRDILRESQMKAAEESDEIIKDARAQAEKILREAHERIADEKAQAVISARREIAQLATDMASRILKREVSEDDNKNAVEDFFRETR